MFQWRGAISELYGKFLLISQIKVSSDAGVPLKAKSIESGGVVNGYVVRLTRGAEANDRAINQGTGVIAWI